MLVENITDLLIFAHVVKQGSLSAAGRDLGYSAAVVSKRLQRLEERLGTRLVNRSTRKLGITEEGARYHEYCVRVLAELEEAEALITKGSRQPKGTLRVTVPAAFGRLHIAPLVPKFLRRYPELRLSLHLSDGIVDIIEDGYDVAVRIGEMKDSNLVARHLGIDHRFVVATPSYLAKHGAPSCPEDLLQCNALLFANPAPLDQWQFVDGEGVIHSIRVSGNFETNNCEALREAIMADLGIALRPAWDVWRDIQNGSLKVLLPDYTPPSFNIQAVYPSRRHLSQKVRVFIDLLQEVFGDTPYWEKE
ncbi:MAG: LysR family transcriptional regulator [Burkholderiales bacterium]